ncbi:MAG: hypothetical protein AAFR71_16580 [Pseudomonadota bacterium]
MDDFDAQEELDQLKAELADLGTFFWSRLLESEEHTYTIGNRTYISRAAYIFMLETMPDDQLEDKFVVEQDSGESIVKNADEIAFGKKGRPFTEEERQIRIQLEQLLVREVGEAADNKLRAFLNSFPNRETDDDLIYGKS